MIKSFKCKETEKLFNNKAIRRMSLDVQRVALRKLKMLDAASLIETLLVPPGNRLERLRGKRRGQYSIRVNNQWRICFRWQDGHAFDVEIVDYH